MTLVELLIAMTLGLLIIAGIGQIYLAAKRSNDIQTSQARIQDVGRYVTELLTQEIRRAGYWGMMTGRQFSNDWPPAPTCVNDPTWGRMVSEKLFGLDDNSGGYACINRLRGDVLTVRYGDPSTVTPYSGTSLYIWTNTLEGKIFTGPDIFPPDPVTSDHELVAHAYYVANSTQARECGQPNAPAPFLPALDREYLLTSGLPQTEELVTGVEQLQFQFGVDTDSPPTGDGIYPYMGSVNRYMNADAVNTWNPGQSPAINWLAVRSVRFWVLVRSDCPEAGYTDSNTYNMGDVSYTPNDGFRRALYTSTVALRN